MPRLLPNTETIMAYDSNTTRRDANLRPETTVSTGIPFWDLMLSFGKASQQALSSYAPRSEYAVQSSHTAQPSHAAVQQTGSSVEVIPVGEETLNVGTRLVSGETTRVRRIVVETPVEQSVSLREERVIVERRKPTGASSTTAQAVLTESTIEMSDSFEVAEVWKSVRVTEEVVLRREVTERHETVRDTVRHGEVVVEQVTRALPAVRHEVEKSQPVAQQPSKPEPAQLAADLKKVAERFETSTEQQDKAPAAKAETPKAEQKPTAPQPQAAKAEQPKTPAMPGRPEASGSQNDKSNFSQKN